MVPSRVLISHSFLGGEAQQTGTSPDHKLANCHWCCLYLRFAWVLVCRVWDLVKDVESSVSHHWNLLTCLGRQHEEVQFNSPYLHKSKWCEQRSSPIHPVHFVSLCRHAFVFFFAGGRIIWHTAYGIIYSLVFIDSLHILITVYQVYIIRIWYQIMISF